MIRKRINHFRSGIVGTLLLATSIIYIVLPILALNWASIPFAGFLLDPHLVVNDTGEAHWAGRQLDPPLAYPERLVAVDGTAVTTNEAFYELLSSKAIGSEISLTFEQPQTSRISPRRLAPPPQRTVTLTLARFTADDLWSQFWMLYLVGIVMLVIGAWTFAARPQTEAAQLFATFTVLSALATGSLFDLVTTQAIVPVWIIALSLGGSFNVLLVMVFPHETHLLRRRPSLKWLLLLPGLGIAIWGLVWLRLDSDPWAYAIPWRAAYILNGVALLFSWAVMAYRGILSPSPAVRQQARLILASAILGFLPLFGFFVLKGLLKLPGLEWLQQELYVPPILIYPLAIGYVIIRYRLLDIDLFLRRGLTYVILIGLLVVSLALVVTSLTSIISIDSPILLALLVVAVAVAFNPLRDHLQRGLDQYLFQRPAKLDELLRAYNRDLTTAVHVDQVANTLLKYINTAMPDTDPQIYLLDSKTSCYSNNNGHMLDIDSPLVRFMSHQNNIIDLSEERTWPPTLREHRELVQTLDATVIVPMNNGYELFGWLSLSAKENHQYFTRAELTYLNTLADQSLIGLERANVVRSLETRVTELDMLSNFSQVLSYTIVIDDLLEVVYTNYYRLFGIDDFIIALRDPETQQIHTAFFLEAGERISEKEGRRQSSNDSQIYSVIKTGQMVVTEDEQGHAWITAPLNAGADTLGAIRACYRNPERHFHQRQQQLFSVFADHTAIALDRLQTEKQLQTRARQLEIINQVTLSLTTTHEVDPLLNLILDKAMELLDTEAGTFILLVEDTGELEFRVARGPASDSLIGSRLPVGTGLAGTVAQTGRPILVNEVHKDARWFAEIDAASHFETQSTLTVPLLRQSTVLGVLQVINKRNGAPFDEGDQRLLMAFAGQAVVALENARLLEQTDQELQQRVNELFMLQQLDRDLNTTLEVDQVLNLALDWSLRICGGTAGAIVLLDENDEPRLRATRGYEASFDANEVESKRLKEGLIGEVLHGGEAHVTGNVHEEPRYIPASFTTHSQLTLPIVHKQRIIGVMAVESDQFDAFDDAICETAVRVTNHAAVAIANALLYEQVHAANQAKSEFVSMVSHELKTPMTSMRGYTDLLLSGVTGSLTERQRNFLQTIAANIERMSRQIRDLTDISRIEMGRLMMVLAPTAFTNVVSETLQTVQPLYDEKRTQLHLDLPADLPQVLGDKERLVQVLTNLLSNACKYSPPDTDVQVTFKTDTIAIKEKEPAQPMVVCSVQDNGYGISEEDQEKLFTKFFRSEDPNIRQATGTGLGLSITKGIIELHGGRIWFESKVGEGTTFHFAIPQA